MNFKFYALRAISMVLVTSLLSNIANATSPDYPEIDETLGKLLIDGMGDLMNDYPETNPDYPTFTDDHYRARFLEMSGEIQYRLTPDIKNHIIHRTERYRSATERTLGLSEMYFPIFEEYLSEKNIPHHLKYLPIVESNLNAVAKSHAAAVGLWQFIPGTGKLYGLKVASYLDERSDTHKASHAAATMLSNLYKRYGDWPLALAAYNCGPGRVDKYVKGNNKDFWDIRKYLPRETQMYVPYFMAVAYSYEYHYLHELKAKRLPSDLVLTDSIHLAPGYQTLSQLSKRYKISLDTLKRLNPGYIKNYIPSGSKLNILVLPARIVANLRNYAPAWHRIMSMKSENPIKCIRRVNSEADLGKLMKAHRFSRNDLLFWNGLPSNYRVKKGDIVAVRKYRVPKDALLPKKVVRKDIQGISIASLKVVGLDDEQRKAVTAPVYVSIKNKKLAQNLSTTSVNPSNRKERSNFALTPTRTSPKTLRNTRTESPKKDEVITTISQNRTRDRRLRNNRSTSSDNTVKIQGNSTNAQNTTTEKETSTSVYKSEESKAARTAMATKRVNELSKSIQSKEQAVIKANSYSTTSVEEVSALSYLNNESEKLKKVRLAKKKDRAAKVAAEKQAKLEAEQAAKAAAEKQAKLEAEEAAKAAAEKQAKLEAEQAAKVAAEKQAKLEAEEAAKAAAEKQAKLEAEQAAKAAAAKQAKLEAEEAAKAAAAKQAKLEAEQAAKAAAAKQAKLEAERVAKAAAEKQAKLEAEQAAKAAAEKQAKLEAEQAAKAAAAKQAKLEAEQAAKAAEEKRVAALAAKIAAEEQAKLEAEQAAAEKEAKRVAELAAKIAKEEQAKLAEKTAAEEEQREHEGLANTYQYHKVKGNETIAEIAAKYKVSISELKALNNIPIQGTLRKGLELKIREK